MEDTLYDFYYSQTQYDIQNDIGQLPANVFLNGKWLVYTEVNEHDKRGSNFNDAILLGTTMLSDKSIKIGYIHGVVMKEVWEDEVCDGECQLCPSETCGNYKLVETKHKRPVFRCQDA